MSELQKFYFVINKKVYFYIKSQHLMHQRLSIYFTRCWCISSLKLIILWSFILIRLFCVLIKNFSFMTYKVNTILYIDSFLSAEISDFRLNPLAFWAVSKCLIHGPCGPAFPMVYVANIYPKALLNKLN